MTPSNKLLDRYPALIPYFEPVPVFEHRLWMFETPEELYPYEIRIKEIDYANTVEMKVNGKLALYKDSHSWERYKRGKVESGSAHHEFSDFDTVEFEDWVESVLKKLLNENIRWGLEDTFKQCTSLSSIEEHIHDIQVLLEYGRKMSLTKSWWFRELWIVESVYQFHCEGSISEESVDNISQFIQDSFSYNWTWFLNTIVPLLPQNPPNKISKALAAKLDESINSAISRGQHANDDLYYIAQYFRQFTTLITSVFQRFVTTITNGFNHPRTLLQLGRMFVKQDVHCHLIQKGLRLCLESPQQFEPYTFSCAFAIYKNHLEHNRIDEANALTPILIEQLLKYGNLVFDRNHLNSKVDMHEWLCTEFITPHKFDDPDQFGNILINIEKQLNAYWYVEWEDHHDRCIKEKRFLSGGSCNYVCWLRTNKDYDQAVSYVMENTKDTALAALRYQTNNAHFELFIGNGLGSFLDGHINKYLQQAQELIGRCEEFISEWSQGKATYQIACVYARCGDIDLALQYLSISLQLGETLDSVEQDSDFQNLIVSQQYKQFKASL